MLSSQVVRTGSEKDQQILVANRPGSGEVRFTRVEILDDKDSQVEEINIGDPLRIRAHFHCGAPIPAPRFAVAIKDVRRNILVATSDSQSADLPEVVQGDGVIDCTFESVPLRPGAYGLYLEIKRWGGQVYDVIADTLPRFTVRGPSPDPERSFVQGQADLVWFRSNMKVTIESS